MACDLFWKRRKHQQTDKTQKVLHTRSSISQSASPCSCLCSDAPRPVRDLAGAATFLATESTSTVLTPSQMSEIAGHESLSQTVKGKISFALLSRTFLRHMLKPRISTINCRKIFFTAARKRNPDFSLFGPENVDQNQ